MSDNVQLADATDATPMQPVAPIDWAEVQALYVKGIGLRDLAARYGVSYTALRCRASRHKWQHTVAKARDVVTQRATEDLSVSVRSWVGKIDAFAHKTIDSLIKRDPDTMSVKEIGELVSATRGLADVFRPNAGLDRKDAGATHVHLGVMTLGATLDARPHMSVIDVDALPALADAPAALAGTAGTPGTGT